MLNQDDLQRYWDDEELRNAATVETGQLDYEELLRLVRVRLAYDAFERSPDATEDSPVYQRVVDARNSLTEYQQKRQERRNPPSQT